MLMETAQSLMVYAMLVKAGRPLTARELLDSTGLRDGTLYPILNKRVERGFISQSEDGSCAKFDLTAEGYAAIRPTLLYLQIDSFAWIQAERRLSS